MIMNPPAEITEATLFFWTGTDNLRRGPVALSQLRNLVRNGTVPKSAQLWCEGWPDWQPLAIVAQQLALPMNTQAAVPADILPIQKPRSWLRIAAWCVAWIALIGTVVGLVAVRMGYREWRTATREIESYAETALISPSTLKICWFWDGTLQKEKSGVVVVSGWFEHRNGFNALVRRKWIVEIAEGGSAKSVTVN